MSPSRIRQFWIVSSINTLLSFILLFAGFKGILKYPLSNQTVYIFLFLSLILGVLTGAFYAIRYRITFWVFVIGTLIGFFIMYYQFLNSTNGWSDLTGLLYLYFMAGIGMAAGLVAELIWRFWKHSHRRDK